MKNCGRAARALAEREATWRQRFAEQKEELDQARWQAQDGASKSREVDAVKVGLRLALKDAADDAARVGRISKAREEAQAKRDADRRVADEALLEARRDAETKLQESKVLVREGRGSGGRGRAISGGLVAEVCGVGTAAAARTVGTGRR